MSCCNNLTTKTPVYLENVIYFFEKTDAYYRKIFAPKNSSCCNSDSTALKILDKLAEILNKSNCNCNGSTEISSEQLNEAIDKYFEKMSHDTDDSDLTDDLKEYFAEKNATLSGDL